MTGFSLKTKMTLAVALLTCTLLGIMALAAHWYYVEQVKQLVTQQQFTMLTALADQIDDKLLSSQNELVEAASTLSPEMVRDPAQVRLFFARRPGTVAMFDNGVCLFSSRGELLYSVPAEPGLLKHDFSGRDYLKNTVATGRPQFSEPFISAQKSRHPILMVTAPVLDRQGRVAAVLAGSLDLTRDNFLTKLSQVRLGKAGYLALVNGSRFIIMHQDRTRVLRQDASPPGRNPLFDRALAGYEGSGETVNSRGVRLISSYKKLKSTGWTLAGMLPQSEAYAPVYRVRNFLLVAWCVAFLVSFLVVWGTITRLTAPLSCFTRQIRHLTRRNTPHPRVSVSSGDEIGDLGRAFNQLLEELEGQRLELRNQLDFSHTLMESIPIPVMCKDAQGRYLRCNRAFEEVSGFARESVIGKTVSDLLPPELALLHLEVEQDLAQDRGTRVMEAEARHADGSVRNVMLFKTAFPRPDGSHGGVVGVMLDITERKRAETALETQKEFAESLVKNSVLPTFVLDPQHRVIIWNKACEQLSGFKSEEILGHRGWKAFYPKPRRVLADFLVDGSLDAIRESYDTVSWSTLTPEGVQTESWFEDRFGEGHYVLLNAAPIRDSQGKLVAVIQTVKDFTERKLAQDAHEKTRRQLQLILDAAGEGIYGVDLEGMITFANPAAGQMVGWEPEALLGRHHMALHHPPGHTGPCPQGDCPVISALCQGVTRQVTDEIFWRRDGTGFTVEYVSTPIRQEGALVGAVVIFKDITQRREAEEQLSKLSQAVMQSPVPILITDLSGTIEFVNHRFNEMSGYQSQEIIGRSTRVLKAGKTRSEVYDSLWRTITAGRAWTGDLQNRHKNGDLYWVHCTISPIRSSSGATTHYMAFLESMTERKQLEEQLRQAQKMEAIGQLAGGVAHDFNNILTVIMGFGQLLAHTLRSDDPNRAHLKQILDAADRATHLTSSLLAFSRKQVMVLQQVELNELARNHTRFLGRIIGEDVTLRTDLCPEELPVTADAGQIEQVLMNLATNARDAMRGGGELRIATRSVTLDNEFYRVHGYGTAGRYALITISDTGCGIDAKIQEKIFEPFFTTKDPGRGTGLGLSIVYGIVKQHGGYLTLESKCGAGTTFNIYLPLTAAHRAEAPALAAGEAPRGAGETILCVEDDPMVRALVDSVLNSYGYRVLLAEDGAHAIRLFEENADRIELALLDVIMPGMNGRQVCEALRQRSPQLKVLFLTGYTADLIQDKGILFDGIDLILKPAQPEEMAKKIREMLDAR